MGQHRQRGRSVIDVAAYVRFMFGKTSLALVLFVCLFVNQISLEPLNGFAPNSHGRRVSSLARTNLNVKVKGHRSRSPGTKRAVHFHHPRQRRNGPCCCMMHCNALAANNVTQQQTRPLRRCRGLSRLTQPSTISGMRIEYTCCGSASMLCNCEVKCLITRVD